MISMKKTLFSCLAAAMPFLSAGIGQAATLGDVTAVPSPSAVSSIPAFGFTVADGLLFGFSGPTVADPGGIPSVLTSSGVDLGEGHVTGMVLGPVSPGPLLLAGSYEDSAVTAPGVVQALFLKAGGSLAGDYGGDYLLLTLTATAGPISLLGTASYVGTAVLTGAELDGIVPLPAGGVLLGSALVLVALRRRKAG
ncbi:hypothetical protein [Mangrovicoccus sp. HB161399]|uniref:hypothetical protein n=1 Tax=Mangrovicoccus sp. HB161399 TaxID=2720392 RepID=UPI001553DFBD|nr:hypothetical protein [Mangrovicoccus sp. HB161399]